MEALTLAEQQLQQRARMPVTVHYLAPSSSHEFDFSDATLVYARIAARDVSADVIRSNGTERRSRSESAPRGVFARAASHDGPHCRTRRHAGSSILRAEPCEGKVNPPAVLPSLSPF